MIIEVYEDSVITNLEEEIQRRSIIEKVAIAIYKEIWNDLMKRYLSQYGNTSLVLDTYIKKGVDSMPQHEKQTLKKLGYEDEDIIQDLFELFINEFALDDFSDRENNQLETNLDTTKGDIQELLGKGPEGNGSAIDKYRIETAKWENQLSEYKAKLGAYQKQRKR